MQLTILGATGRAGSAVTEKALEDRHFVTALVRNPAKLTIQHEHLTVVQGDATDPAAVGRAVYSTAAVISAMAHRPRRKLQKANLSRAERRTSSMP